MPSAAGMQKGLWGLTRVTLLFGPIQIGAIVHELTDGEESAATLAGKQLLFLGRHKERLASLQPTTNCQKTSFFCCLVGCFCPPSLYQMHKPAQDETGWTEINPSQAALATHGFIQTDFSSCTGKPGTANASLQFHNSQAIPQNTHNFKKWCVWN